MHTQDPNPIASLVQNSQALKMIYIFGARIPELQEILWYATCGVCDSHNTYPTYGEALELVNVHARTHYGPQV